MNIQNGTVVGAQAEWDRRVDLAEKKVRWIEEQVEEQMQRLDVMTAWDAVSDASVINWGYVVSALKDYDHADAGLRLENIVRDYIRACVERKYPGVLDEA